MRKSIIPFLYLLLMFSGFVISCGSGNNKNGLKPTLNESRDLLNEGNAIDQTNPTLMVFPSDALLQRLGCINEIENQGTLSYHRNYSKAYIQDSELKFAIASVEKTFSEIGYPLENLEQQLKQINNDNAMGDMDRVAKDPRTLLMNTARPDFILEIDYEYKQDPDSRNPKKILNYILTVLDAYTNKSIASLTQAGLVKTNENASLASMLKDDLEKNISVLQDQIKQRFSDELANGVEITLKVSIDEEAFFNLTDECLGKQNYNDWVNDWLKKNTVNSSFKPVINTDKELKFTNVRIKPKTKEGKRYTAFDFANDFNNDFNNRCGIKAINRTQGIGDAYLIISGLN